MKLTARVFISSTREDLTKYRAAAAAACKAQGLVAVGMEDFEATEAGAVDGSLEKLKTCDILIGIYAHRYGYIPENCEVSVTELEYRQARKADISCLCFLIDEDHDWPPKLIEFDRQQELNTFKKSINGSHIRAKFRGEDDFRLKVENALAWWKERNGFGRDIDSKSMLPDEHHRSDVIRATWQLPADPADFVGREEMMNDLIFEFTKKENEPGAIIVGLHGMGGIGKTSIAIRLAHRIADQCPDGHIFIDLHGDQSNPRSVEDVMRHVIRTFEPHVLLPPEKEQLAILYRHVLHDRRALIVLDNVADKSQVKSLIPPGNCRLVVTSRNEFSLPGCIRRQVDQLSLQEATQLVELKCRRALPHARELAESCACHPLALSCALEALDAMTLSPDDYIEHLSDVRNRMALTDGERSVEAVIQASYELLDPDLQRRFRHLGVFRSNFVRSAAAAMWEMPDGPDVGLTLSHLKQMSLVLFDATHGRYRLHDLIREFVRLQTDCDLSELRKRHAEHFSLANRLPAAKGISFADEPSIRKSQLISERENIEYAFEWVREHQEDSEDVARICCDFLMSWHEPLQGVVDNDTCVDWAQHGVKAAEACDRNSDSRYWGFLGDAFFASRRFEDALAAHEVQLSKAQDTDESMEVIRALGNISNDYARLKLPEKALEYAKRDLEFCKQELAENDVAMSLVRLGLVYWYDFQDFTKASESYESAADMAKKAGYRRAQTAAAFNLGMLHEENDDLDEAIRKYEIALNLAESDGRRIGVVYGCEKLASVFQRKSDHAKAIPFLKRIVKYNEELNRNEMIVEAVNQLGHAFANAGQYQEALESHAHAAEIAEEIQDIAKLQSSVESCVVAARISGGLTFVEPIVRRAVSTMHRLGHEGKAAALLCSMGEAFALFGDPQKAEIVFKQAINVAENAKVIDLIGRGLSGMIKASEGPDSACLQPEFIRHYVTLLETEDGHSGVADVFNVLCDKVRNANSKLALEYLHSAIEYGIKASDAHRVAKLANQLIDFFSCVSNRDDALAAVNNAIEFLCVREELRHAIGVLSRLAEFWAQEGNHSEAERTHSRALHLATAAENWDAVSDQLWRVVCAKHSLGDNDSALELYKQHIQVFRNQKQADCAAVATRMMGHVQEWRGEWKAAQECFQRAIKLSEKASNHWHACHAKNALGRAKLRSGRFAESQRLFEEMKSLADDKQFESLAASAVCGIGAVQKQRGQLNDAVASFSNAELISRKTSNSEWLEFANWHGNTLRNQGKVVAAQDRYDEIIACARENKQSDWLAIGLLNRAAGEIELGSVDNAESMLAEIESDLERRGDKRLLSYAIQRRSAIAAMREDFARALELAENGRVIARESFDEEVGFDSLSTLSTAYRNVERFEKAIELREQVLAHRLAVHDHVSKVYTEAALAEDWLRSGNLNNSRPLITRSIRRSRDLGMYGVEGQVLALTAEIFWIAGTEERAICRMREAIAILRELGLRDHFTLNGWRLAKMLCRTGALDEAIQLMEERIEFEQSIGHVEVDRHRAELSTVRG